MSLIITRRPGEAIVSIDKDGTQRRLYIVAVEGNTVRLALDAPKEVQIVREELLPPEARQRWWEDRGGRWLKIALAMATTLALDKLTLLGF